MSFSLDARSGIRILKVNERRAALDIATDIKDCLFSEIENKKKKIIVDLNYVEFVDSSFLGSLVAGLKLIQLKDGEIKIAELHPHVRITFELTKLDKLFNIYHTVEEAMRSFNTA